MAILAGALFALLAVMVAPPLVASMRDSVDIDSVLAADLMPVLTAPRGTDVQESIQDPFTAQLKTLMDDEGTTAKQLQGGIRGCLMNGLKADDDVMKEAMDKLKTMPDGEALFLKVQEFESSDRHRASFSSSSEDPQRPRPKMTWLPRRTFDLSSVFPIEGGDGNKAMNFSCGLQLGPWVTVEGGGAEASIKTGWQLEYIIPPAGTREVCDELDWVDEKIRITMTLDLKRTLETLQQKGVKQVTFEFDSKERRATPYRALTPGERVDREALEKLIGARSDGRPEMLLKAISEAEEVSNPSEALKEELERARGGDNTRAELKEAISAAKKIREMREAIDKARRVLGAQDKDVTWAEEATKQVLNMRRRLLATLLQRRPKDFWSLAKLIKEMEKAIKEAKAKEVLESSDEVLNEAEEQLERVKAKVREYLADRLKFYGNDVKSGPWYLPPVIKEAEKALGKENKDVMAAKKLLEQLKKKAEGIFEKGNKVWLSLYAGGNGKDPIVGEISEVRNRTGHEVLEVKIEYKKPRSEKEQFLTTDWLAVNEKWITPYSQMELAEDAEEGEKVLLLTEGSKCLSFAGHHVEVWISDGSQSEFITVVEVVDGIWNKELTLSTALARNHKAGVMVVKVAQTTFVGVKTRVAHTAPRESGTQKPLYRRVTGVESSHQHPLGVVVEGPVL